MSQLNPQLFITVFALLCPQSVLATSKCEEALNPKWHMMGSTRVNVTQEHWESAYSEIAGSQFYYGKRLSTFDQTFVKKESSKVKLEPGKNITDREFEVYLERLSLSDQDVAALRGKKILSIGEGNSNFTKSMLEKGVDAWSVDVAIKNPHAPDRSVLAYAQALPFKDQEFDETVSVWLIQHFFRPTAGSSMFNPTAGREAILEMLRVTKVDGVARINPILGDSTPIIDFLDFLQAMGLIKYVITPHIEVIASPYYIAPSDRSKFLTRRIQNSGEGQNTSAIVTRLR